MDSKACRIHGRVQVNKIKGDNIVVSLGSEIGIENLLAQFSGIPFGICSNLFFSKYFENKM